MMEWLGQRHVKRAIHVAAVQDHTLKVELDGKVRDDFEIYVTAYAYEFDCKVLSWGTADMYITLPTPQPDLLLKEKHNELPVDYYRDQISAAKLRVKTVTYNLQAHRSLLTNMLKQYKLSQWRFQVLIDIAKSIAALAEVDEVNAAHFAEAILYIVPKMEDDEIPW